MKQREMNNTINPPGFTAPPVFIDDSIFYIDLAKALPSFQNPKGFLTAGATLTFTFGIAYASNYATSTPTPVPFEDVVFVTWSYTLIKDYISVNALATDADFVDKIGTLSTIKPITTASTGLTLTDVF